MNHNRARISYILVVILFLAGCSGKLDQADYNNAIEDGLDSFAAKDYEKAEAYFDIALNEKENDDWAKSLLNQASAYKESVNLFEEEKYTEAIEKAEEVVNISNGSEAISEKASKLIAEIEEQSDENKKENEKNYSFEDFIGYYLHFSDEDSSIADMLLTIDQQEIAVYYRGSDFYAYDIISKTIDGNNLTIDYYGPPSSRDAEEYGTAKYEYIQSNDKIMIIANDNIYRKVPYEELEGYGYLIDNFMGDYGNK